MRREHTLPTFPGLNVDLEELDALEPMLSDEDLGRLRILRGAARPPLSDAQGLLKHAMKSVRLEAICALGRMGKDATSQLPTLKTFLKDERTFDMNAISWMQGVGRLQAQAAQAIALIESAD